MNFKCRLFGHKPEYHHYTLESIDYIDPTKWWISCSQCHLQMETSTHIRKNNDLTWIKKIPREV